MADNDRSSLGVEIGDELSIWFTPQKLPELPGVRDAMRTTDLVPLWYAPLLFCGEPGKPEAFIQGDNQGVFKSGRCMVRWVELIARAVDCGELPAREPDGLSVMDKGETITPNHLVYWRELEAWAKDRHGLSAGFSTMKELENRSNPVNPIDKPLGEVERRTLLTIIAALAQHAKIETARHEAAGVIIARLTDAIGAHVDAGTIARHLKKIPDAIEARAK
ncbi:hypothetical protein [Thiocapsa sp.]|uniref:hypothetical protein n=1 Tax=Thiocapsa sp. TaxID=2024551 RepID=UPI0035943E78